MSTRSSRTSPGQAAYAALVAIALLSAPACSKNPTPATTPTTSPGEVVPSAPSAASSVTSAAMGAAGPLVSSLVSAVPGISPEQASLAAGALLGLAKTKMPGDQYSELSGAVPGTDALVSGAQKQGLPSSPSSLASVTEFLGKTGISPSQVSQLASALGSSVAGKVSPNTASAFLAALK